MQKIYVLDKVGPVVFKKSARAKRLIFKIDHNGQPIVVLPRALTFFTAKQYALKNTAWFADHIKKMPKRLIADGDLVAHRFKIVIENQDTDTIRTRTTNDKVVLKKPISMSSESPEVQAKLQQASTRAVKRLAEESLPTLVYDLARQYGYQYRTISVKNTRSRWGSCSNQQNINLSIWLVQLPDELIKYVICHELVHLNHMNHSMAFKQELSSLLPNYRALQKQLKNYQPRLVIS